MLQTMYVEHPDMGEILEFFDFRFEVDGIEYVHPSIRYSGDTASSRPMFELVDDSCPAPFCSICNSFSCDT